MIRGLYAIRDNVANAIVGGVHTHAHNAPAIRMFSDIAASEGTQIHLHLPDHDLLKIAEYNVETGQVFTIGEPEIVISGATLKATWDAQQATSTPS